MFHTFYKLIFLSLLFTLHLQATSQTNINKEITNLKEQLIKLEITYNTKNQYIDKDFESLKNDIKELESKLEKETIDKNSIQKDYENFHHIIEMQDKNIDKLNFYVAFFAVLITVLVLYITLRNEGIARNVASEEIDEWIKKKADKKLGDIIDKYQSDFDKHLNDASYSLASIKETEKKVKSLFSNLTESSKSITEDEKEKLKVKSDSLKESKDKDFTLIELEELFLSAYYEKNYEEAIEYSKKIIENTPSSDAYYNMGIIYSKIRQYRKAINLYKIALEKNPNKDAAFNNMGVSYAMINQYEKSMESYKKAIEINSKNYDAHNNMGNLYGKLEEYEKAIKSYKKVIEINPIEESAYTNLFEMQIISNLPFDKELEYLALFKENKNYLIKYDMLKILSQINDNKETDTSIWLNNYKEQTLGSWSFTELESWIETKTSPIKEKLLEAIDVFKTKND